MQTICNLKFGEYNVKHANWISVKISYLKVYLIINLQHWIYCHAVTFKKQKRFLVSCLFPLLSFIVGGKGKKNELHYKEPQNQTFLNLGLKGGHRGGGYGTFPPPEILRQIMFPIWSNNVLNLINRINPVFKLFE